MDTMHAWRRTRAGAVMWCVSLAACGGGGGSSAARTGAEAHQPSEHEDAGAPDAGGDGGSTDARAACDLRGTWIDQHSTHNTALGALQIATNWSYHRIEQDGDRFRIVDSLDCGYVVRGTTDVSLADATLEAMALYSTNAVGTEGTFAPTADGENCELAFDRIYVIRGANKQRFLDAVWQIGDPPKELDAFDLPRNAMEGMEDWDEDGHEALTQLTGLGDRYTAEIDWHAMRGQVPQHSDRFGGEGVISVDYDGRESVSAETPPLLQASSVPMSPGYGYLARVDRELRVVEDGDHPELQTCKNVQALAVEMFGDPPSP
jgi:hypothetical protein